MPWLLAVMLIYGLFNIVLGVEAYMSKGSLPSLIAAGGLGLVVIACAALAKTNPRVAYITATVVALLIIGRFMKPALEGTIWPATVIVIVSAIFALTLIGAHFIAVKKRKREEAEASRT